MKQVKYLSLYMTIIALLMLLATGCAPSGEKAEIQVKPRPSSVLRPPSSDESRETKDEGRAGVELALKFSEGDSTTYKVITEAQRKIKGEGALLENDKFKGGTTGNRVEFTFTQQIQSVDAQDNAVAKITIDKLKYSTKVKDKVTTDFDSSREKDRNSPLYNLIGLSYTIEISPEGQVSKIIDVPTIGTSGGSANQDASMLLKPEAIKLRHTIPALPASPAKRGEPVAEKNKLRPGDSWNNVKPFTFGMMGSKSYERIYTLKEIEDMDNRRTALIQMSAIPSAGTVAEPQEEQAMGIFSKMFDNTEKYTGVLKLDLNTGKVEEYSEKLQSEWVAVDPEAGQKADSEPAALRMTATRFYHIEKIDSMPIHKQVEEIQSSAKSPLLPEIFVGKWVETESFVGDSKKMEERAGKSQFIIKAGSIMWKREHEGKETYTAEKYKVESGGKKIILAATEIAYWNVATGEKPRRNIDVTLTIEEGKLIATTGPSQTPVSVSGSSGLSVTSLGQKVVYERR